VSFELRDQFPELVAELSGLLVASDEKQLARTVPTLTVVDRCRCADSFCAMMYTAPPPDGAYGPTHRNIALDPKKGMLILDVLDERIVGIEVLYRNDIRDRLFELMP
jgi:hypothetical protein